MIYKLVYLAWSVLSVCVLIRMDSFTQQQALVYFCASVAVLGLPNLFASRRIIKAVEKLEPDNYENIRLYFGDAKQHKDLLKSEVPEIQKLIRTYLSIRPYSGIMVLLVLAVEVYLCYL